MQHSFEQEVQQKMEEMKLSPSAPVWEKVELEIQPEKKRKRIFFWIFIPLLIASIGAWWYVTAPGKSISSMPQQLSQQPFNKKTGDTISLLTTSLKKADANQTLIFKNGESALHKSSSKSTAITLVNSNKIKSVDSKNTDQSNSTQQTLNGSEPSTTASSIKQHDGLNTLVPNSKATNIKNDETTSKNATLINQSIPQEKDSVRKDEVKKQDHLIPTKTDSVTKIKMAKLDHKWSRYISFRIGESSYHTAYSGSSTAFAANYSPTGISNPSGTTNVPSATKAGLSFSIGYGFKKFISRKLSLSLGLQYSYYSTSIHVGNLQTSSRAVYFNADTIRTNQYYTTGTQQAYRNKFGLIELPLYLQYAFTKKLSFGVGASYGKLLKSTALTYDYTSGGYYFNKANNKQSQLNLSAVIQYHFQLKGKLKIATGPVFQYNLLRLQNDLTQPAPHLAAAGLKTEIFFK